MDFLKNYTNYYKNFNLQRKRRQNNIKYKRENATFPGSNLEFSQNDTVSVSFFFLFASMKRSCLSIKYIEFCQNKLK